jgi:hypothetical protein
MEPLVKQPISLDVITRVFSDEVLGSTIKEIMAEI